MKIFILNQEINNLVNHQSFIINKCKTFEEYVNNIKEYFPKDTILYTKNVNYKDRSVVLTFELKMDNDRYVEFMHFAKVIEL